MTSIVIPTRNRAYTLKKVLDSYYQQSRVSEIIFVDDYSEDDTRSIINEFAEKYPRILTRYFRSEKRIGASACKIIGYQNAGNEYVLFGEDDVYLEENYVEVLFSKFSVKDNMGIVSGRLIYLLYREEPQAASKRFGSGLNNREPFNRVSFVLNHGARFSGDIWLPFTHALFMTKKELLMKFGCDPYYVKGNSFREETDFQVNTFLRGYGVLITNDTHCFHLFEREVKSGGQRMNRLKRLYWSVYYTKYFFDKYHDSLRKTLGIKYSKRAALFFFAIHASYNLFIRPILKLPAFVLRTLIK